MPHRILFVCTGNICRSPLAEAVFRHKIAQAGHDRDIIVDSAGTHDYHVGDRPDPRTLKIAEMNAIPTDGILARQVKKSDFSDFDLILGMDKGHVIHLKRIAPLEYHHKIHLFLDFTGAGQADVADPYYGEFEGFEAMFRVINGTPERFDLTLSKILCKL